MKFPVPEKDAIANNHICATTGIDSFEYKYRTPGSIDTQITCSLNDYFYNGEGDIFKYDTSGNIIYRLPYSTGIRRWENWERYLYDSLGLSREHFNKMDKFRSTYAMLPGKNVLKRTDYIAKHYECPIFDSTLYYFDDSGRLLMDIRSRNGYRVTMYFYDAVGKLTTKKMKLFDPVNNYAYQNYYFNIPTSVISHYYYKGKLLDSITTETFFLTKQSQMDRQYYDSDGLLYKGVFAANYNVDRTGKMTGNICDYDAATIIYYHRKYNQ